MYGNRSTNVEPEISYNYYARSLKKLFVREKKKKTKEKLKPKDSKNTQNPHLCLSLVKNERWSASNKEIFKDTKTHINLPVLRR